MLSATTKPHNNNLKLRAAKPLQPNEIDVATNCNPINFFKDYYANIF